MLTQQTFVLMKTSWNRLEDVFHLRLQKTSSIRLQDVLIKTNIIALVIRHQNFFKTFSRRLEDVLKISSKCLAKTSSKRFQDVLQKSLQDVVKTYHKIKLFLLTCFKNDFGHIQNVSEMYCQDVYLLKDLPRSNF